ncbi:MAG: electron transport complex protein RnfG [Enterobacterales bacterium]|jgi:electron transport complex protein RnfG
MNSDGLSSANNSMRNGIILAIFALVTTGLTALTWLLTKDQIESEKELALLRAISELVPAELYTNDPYRDCVLLTNEQLLGTKEPQHAWRLRKLEGAVEKNVAVLISSVAPNGYNGAIEIIVGHYLDNKSLDNKSLDKKNLHKASLNKSRPLKTSLAGVRVTNHQETPGLGDKIETRKSNWILQFADLTTTTNNKNKNKNKNYWQVKKDGGHFDAFTGATITPRALLSAVKKNIDYFHQHQQSIFAAEANCLPLEKDSAQKEQLDE